MLRVATRRALSFGSPAPDFAASAACLSASSSASFVWLRAAISWAISRARARTAREGSCFATLRTKSSICGCSKWLRAWMTSIRTSGAGSWSSSESPGTARRSPIRPSASTALQRASGSESASTRGGTPRGSFRRPRVSAAVMRIHQSGSLSSPIVAGTMRGSSKDWATSIAEARTSWSGSDRSSMVGSRRSLPKARIDSSARSRAQPARVFEKTM